MEVRNIICLMIDRLQAAALGAYGNTWAGTPEFDRLAAESCLFDNALADALDLDWLYRDLWHGLPALWPAETALDPKHALPAIAVAAGLHAELLTDEPEVAHLPAAAEFSNRTLLRWQDADRAAAEIDETRAARLMADVSELVAGLPQPFLAWVHAQGMGGPWDAPYKLRSQHADEEDPAPPDFVSPPCRQLPEDFDPDELLGIRHAYAGQVSLWDQCLGSWLEQFRDSALAANTLLAVFSTRGFPLGEHRRVGPFDQALYNEGVQVPLMLRFPDGLGRLARSQALVLPADLPATLLDWLGRPMPNAASPGHSLLPLVRWEAPQVRQVAVLNAGVHDWGVRTPAWHLRVREPGEGADSRQVELYSKPSDRYEVNDVADRAPGVVAALEQVLTTTREAPTVAPPPLDPLLVEEVD